MKKFFGPALFLGLALGVNSAIFAQDNNSQNSTPNAQEKTSRKDRTGKMREGARHRGGKNETLGAFNGLNLTDAQKQQIRDIRRNNQAAAEETARREMRELMQAKRSGGALTADQQARLNTLREQSRVRAERMHQQILAVLTPEQREQLEQNKAQRKNGREGRRRMQNSPMN